MEQHPVSTMTAHRCLIEASVFTKFACFLQLEAALHKAQKLVKQNEEQQSSLQQKLQSSMAGRQDTVRLSTEFDAHDQSLHCVCKRHVVLLSCGLQRHW